MFDHVTIRATDRAASERFYNTVLQTLGIDESYRTRTFTEWQDYGLTASDREHPPTLRLHVGFVAPDRQRVHDFWQAAVNAGYRDDGPPGPRPEYGEDYYGAFLLDPDGNSAEACHHDTLRRDGIVDHLWIRVADLDQSRAFYETVAPHAGLRKDHDSLERVQFHGARGSFSLLPGPVTEHLHMAFGTDDDAHVERFHRSAIDAGYRSNGEPAERARYHPGYFAAYVLDPDGNNIEVVNHHRQ
ncbi:MAG: VOC family protein [Solirubrobacterales bacterium]|nr:VOC family protein [Solirubrobacterales bacterium]